MDKPEKKLPPMRYCGCCGEKLGRSHYRDPYDTCGKPECDREARSEARADREEAHERLDRDMGW